MALRNGRARLTPAPLRIVLRERCFLVLNMLSTAVMIRIGRVEDNKMVNMQLTNSKLVDRGTRMVMEGTGLTDYEQAKELLLRSGSVKKAVDSQSN